MLVVVVRLVFVILSVAGCSFVPLEGLGIDGGDGRDAGDAGDAGPDAREVACNAWPQPPTGVDPCTGPEPTGELNLCAAGTFVYSTTDGTMSGAPTPASQLDANVRIVAVNRLVICAGQTLTIIGAHPVIFVVHGAAEIAGTLDASASPDAQGVFQPGPGGDLCGAGSGTNGANSSAGAGGGAGGGFGRAGGDGGSGDGIALVTGGAAEGTASLSPIRGGCRGGAGGGDGNSSESGGPGGPGGGGVHLAVRDALVVTGSVRAGGGPGLGGKAANAGGGGGGAGGGIFLDAASVQITGAVCANGGGGGGGANDGGPLEVGGDGASGTCALVAAMNGTGGTDNGKPGGKGGFGQVAAEDGVGADEGGGGGGGAVGRLRIKTLTPAISGIVTPPAAM
jgi:hypothetical protein